MNKETLYIFHNTEDGISCDIIFPEDFGVWVKYHTDDIKPEYLPVFIDKIPDAYTPINHYCIIKGEIIHPTPVQVVTEYKI